MSKIKKRFRNVKKIDHFLFSPVRLEQRVARDEEPEHPQAVQRRGREPELLDERERGGGRGRREDPVGDGGLGEHGEAVPFFYFLSFVDIFFFRG